MYGSYANHVPQVFIFSNIESQNGRMAKGPKKDLSFFSETQLFLNKSEYHDEYHTKGDIMLM